jgi:hypothetical protein
MLASQGRIIVVVGEVDSEAITHMLDDLSSQVLRKSSMELNVGSGL